MRSRAGDMSNSGQSDEFVALHPAESGMQFGRALLHALHNAGISVLYQDREMKTIWARNMRAPWTSDGADSNDILPAAQAERIGAARHNVVASGNPERLELSVPADDGVRWFQVWIDADHGDGGAVQGVVTTMVETTEQKRREQTLKTLLREVSHRSKNLLAIIQSIATQTGRYSDTLGDFLTRFRGRLQSLASSQDLVTSSNWRGAALRELVSGQVGRYGADPLRSLRFRGENPYLNPNAALHIGLAMHELAVNSVSYGALSRPDGFVEVTADLTAAHAGEPALSLTWAEAIGANDNRRNEKRFGSVALERVVPTSLNGTATLEIAGGRLEYRLIVPRGNFETD
ncbi:MULTISPECIES: sensor histidine kinase [unclassified Mesorhizobium]|uniref:sensor histidine kinase n=1 Tax=unclassified Mesorhizobium TaxID=325217 RepID=UPI000FD7DACC|nr:MULTISPECIES: sensor histidine kinase [unclassified Mesorhizobium]TGQ45752.1 sensor histidine kinase [Mesorhizobium sp. M00.F.Ca.ET.216.01.1.1]TIS56286.1 MAG: sensor histidine kinase [Mesorhizobium sp.]TIS87558.1 MAG: sensor histidine kinase [Mesorhizobium sp.]TJW12910.1 MAG: sensor histidine kinase [Mesorhizobium sp.]TJW48107.1 MAG: sensor histidine kinase [Mesorhizobium sp.]